MEEVVKMIGMVRIESMVNLVRMRVIATALPRRGECLMVDNATKFS